MAVISESLKSRTSRSVFAVMRGPLAGFISAVSEKEGNQYGKDNSDW